MVFCSGMRTGDIGLYTASAKALTNIQQKNLPQIDPDKRVLGVIRPTTEIIGRFSKTGEIGILGTSGTVQSMSYPIEIAKFFPECKVYQEACPMWVPLVENNEYQKPGADYFIQENIGHIMQASANIDTLLLACTHYPLLLAKIKQFLPAGVTVVSQGEIVANSLVEYLQKHVALAEKISQNGQISFYTTDSVTDFDNHAGIFFGKAIASLHLDLQVK